MSADITVKKNERMSRGMPWTRQAYLPNAMARFRQGEKMPDTMQITRPRRKLGEEFILLSSENVNMAVSSTI